MQMLVYSSVQLIGKEIHDAIIKLGYTSTYPYYIENFLDKKENDFQKELDEADLIVELRFIGKNIFLSSEVDLVQRYSESTLESKLGIALIREAIPILVQYEVREDFPYQKSENIIATPDFVVLDPNKPVAVYCDSYRYHQRKKDQATKNKRIDRKLQALGFRVFRFDEHEITTNLESCIEEIKAIYLGKQFALSNSDIILRKIGKTARSELSKWEQEFIDSLLKRIEKGEKVSLREETILNTILNKFFPQPTANSPDVSKEEK
jgi:hypothetical protein